MRLANLIKSIGIPLPENFKDFEVRGISSDSRKVQNNFIFVAIKGDTLDGENFIPEAIHKGAKAIVTHTYNPLFANSKDIVYIKVCDPRKVFAELIAQFYGRPSDNLKVIGITGTNGKTTVSFLIEAILKSARFNPAVIGTINYRFKDRVFDAVNTTPDAGQLQNLFFQMQREDVDYVIIEVSSHALVQKRIESVRFSSAIFTNLGRDHLDYHGDLNSYFSAKSCLFKELPKDSFAILNADDIYGVKLKSLTGARVITYGMREYADVIAEKVRFSIDGTEFCVNTPQRKNSYFSETLDNLRLTTSLIGTYNIYNILAAVAFALSQKIESAVIREAIRGFSGVPGRLERISTKSNFSVFIDYAHTEEALENVITTLRLLCRGHLYVVFGCGGNRDRLKRPRMGRIATELADYVIVTTDNPRLEDAEQIIAEIVAGINKKNYKIVIDRKEAIKEALSSARRDDIILIAGRGHESQQILKNKIIPFDDREVVRECLGLVR